MIIDRKIYFDKVRAHPFNGVLAQEQVDGQEAILTRWETDPPSDDLRHLAYCLSTQLHETASTCQPIEEYGKGAGMSYGKPDPETKQVYYGRGYVQLTWRDNYKRATRELGLEGDDDLEWHAGRALDPIIAAEVMFIGMMEGWFRTGKDGTPETLGKYFNADRDDAFSARDIINGDKTKVPSWSHGVNIGTLIAGYHVDFLDALEAATKPPVPEPDKPPLVAITVRAPEGIEVVVEVERV